jgi:hypothetical protein
MTPRRVRSVGLLLATLVVGCGSSAGNPYSPLGSDDGGGGSFLGGDASVSGALDASIEQDHVAIRFITLSCAGDCASVEAVATGGHPPYTFAWDDGWTNATRRVCPTSDTNYQVKVSDAGSSGELTRPAQTVEVPLTADVIACPDGGTSDGGGAPTVYWANWTQVTPGTPGSATGTLSPPSGDVQVSYAGEVDPESATTGGTTLSGVGPVTFAPPSTFLSATVANAPPPTGMIALAGTGMVAQTITFSTPVLNPLIAVLGVGNPLGGSLEFDFDATPRILSTGPYVVTGITTNGTLAVSGQSLTGSEGTGVVEFAGTFTSIAFTIPMAEQLGDFAVLTVGMRGR